MAKRPAQRDPVVEALKEKMARDPFSRAFLQLAEEYRREGQYDEAIKVCLEGLQRHPAYHTARIALGRTYLECGNLEEARRTLGEVVTMAPENHLAAKLLAEVQRQLGDGTAAAETYRTILAHYPADAEVKALLQDLVGGARPVPAAPPAARSSDPVLDYHSDDLAAAGLAPPAAGPRRPAAEAARKPPGGIPEPAAPVARAVAPVPPTSRSATPPAGPAVRQSVVTPPAIPGPNPAAPTDAPADAPGPGAAGGTGDDAAGADEDALQTNTLAELYLRQGLVDRAIEVYRGMLRVDPANARARRRLQDLSEGGLTPGSPGAAAIPATAGITGPHAATAAAPTPPRPSALPAVPVIAHPGTRARIDRLAAWLGRIQAAGREAGPS
jgi:tetratricopeptide (TPR) repeat protein